MSRELVATACPEHQVTINGKVIPRPQAGCILCAVQVTSLPGGRYELIEKPKEESLAIEHTAFHMMVVGGVEKMIRAGVLEGTYAASVKKVEVHPKDGKFDVTFTITASRMEDVLLRSMEKHHGDKEAGDAPAEDEG